jgi:hypothetical protein
MTNPDPNRMIKYRDELLPDLLTSACEVDEDLARRIGDDVLHRAEALAALPTRDQDVLIAPFVEEVFDHKPLDSPLDLKAKVTLVVRNSLLEQANHDGPWTRASSRSPSTPLAGIRRGNPKDRLTRWATRTSRSVIAMTAGGVARSARA